MARRRAEKAAKSRRQNSTAQHFASRFHLVRHRARAHYSELDQPLSIARRTYGQIGIHRLPDGYPRDPEEKTTSTYHTAPSGHATRCAKSQRFAAVDSPARASGPR